MRVLGQAENVRSARIIGPGAYTVSMSELGSSRVRAWAWLVLCGAMIALSGCYRHVVSARGFGTESVTIHEANLPEAQSESGGGSSVSRQLTPEELNRNATRPN